MQDASCFYKGDCIIDGRFIPGRLEKQKLKFKLKVFSKLSISKYKASNDMKSTVTSVVQKRKTIEMDNVHQTSHAVSSFLVGFSYDRGSFNVGKAPCTTLQLCNLQLVVCKPVSPHPLNQLVRQQIFPICTRWALFQVSCRPKKEIKAKWGDGRDNPQWGLLRDTTGIVIIRKEF